MDEKHERILVLPATKKDGESTLDLLKQNRMPAHVCKDIEELCHCIQEGAGAVVIAKESMNPESTIRLAAALKRQPAWSYLPIVVLISSGDISKNNESAIRFLRPLRNTTLLERPVRVGTFLSVLQAALSDRRRQYEVRDLLDQLEKSRQEAVEASRVKSRFLANMSHEIRTPLGAILGFSELLFDPAVSEAEKKSYIDVVKRNGKLLSALIDDVLDLTKVEAGRIDLEQIPVSLNELVSEVVTALQPTAVAKGIRLLVEWDQSVPPAIQTDPVRLKQILMNIVGNAIKFTPEGSVSVRLHAEGEIGNWPDRLYFCVADTGIGLAEEQAARLFEPFTQADSSMTRRFGGTGLGLALSRQLARALGGDLRLKHSEVGRGSLFEIMLDISNAQAFEANESQNKNVPRAIDSEAKAAQLVGCAILVVDDSKDNQVLISRILQLSGAVVETADNGEEGIQKALSRSFDAVLMDIQMPRLGGYEATMSLRKSGYNRPIIAFTAHALKDDRDRCLAAGCDGYLTKPVRRAELIQTVLAFTDSNSKGTPGTVVPSGGKS